MFLCHQANHIFVHVLILVGALSFLFVSFLMDSMLQYRAHYRNVVFLENHNDHRTRIFHRSEYYSK